MALYAAAPYTPPPPTVPLWQRPGYVPWSPELLASLDWLRLSELLRALAVNAGCQLGASRVEADGMVQFAMLQQVPGTSPTRTLVRMLGWNASRATAQHVVDFAQQLNRVREAVRGVLVAVGGVSPGALKAAGIHQMEVLDAPRLAETLCSLPAEKSEFYYSLTTVGDFARPTCPICLKKLKQVTQAGAAKSRPLRLDCVFDQSGIIPEPIYAEKVEVMRGCEVAFLGEVRARMIIIRGEASGNFVCDGPVVLDPGAILSGSVAARSIRVLGGAELRGPARILDGTAEAIEEAESSWFWRCEGGAEACQKIVFDPHGWSEAALPRA